MALKKYLIVLLVGCVITFCGCGNAPTNKEDNTAKFLKYGGQEYLINVEYQVKDLTQPLTVYFPVITNKKITETQFGGVGAKLKLSSGKTTVKLKADLQDNLNNNYNGYYISFLKYRVDIDNSLCLQANDCIELCDTLLWIFHDTEFETIQIADTYLQINIVANESEIYLPDWNAIIDDMQTNIQLDLSEHIQTN